MFLPNSLDALIGLYLTPFIANGIRKGIIIALKINADKIALDGELSPIIFKTFICGIAIVKIAGIIANGETDLYNLDHIDRGYECIEEKFRKLGANITRVNEE